MYMMSEFLFQFLLIFRKAAAGELLEDSGLKDLYQNVTEIDVDETGVSGAKDFFMSKVLNLFPLTLSVSIGNLPLGGLLIVQGPVVQNFVSLMPSLSLQFVNYISTSKANTLLFFVDKM